MSKKNLLFLALVLALVISACTRQASTAPQATPTLEANFPQPVATTNMNTIEMAGTQTAIASMGSSQSPDVAVASFTPSAGGDQQSPVVVQPTSSDQAPAPAADTALPSPTPDVVVVVGTPVPVVQPGSHPDSYTLKSGEFPYCIARRYNVNQTELLQINGLSLYQGSDLPVGYTLKLPQTGKPFEGARALKTHPATYTVQAGDTVYNVACQYGDVDPMAIASANNLASPYTLTVGTQIQIP